MKQLSRYFLRGLIALLPIVLTVYVLVMFLTWSESVTFAVLEPFVGDFYVPGMGILLCVACLTIIGWLLPTRLAHRLVSYFELPFTNIPVVKSIYSSIKSFADYFSPGTEQGSQQVVVLRMPGQPLEMVGLITRAGSAGLPDGFLRGDRVAVYLPMGYMIGGYTVFVPRDWVHPIDMSVEAAMRLSLTAWMMRTAEEVDANPDENPGEDMSEKTTEEKPKSPAAKPGDTQ